MDGTTLTEMGLTGAGSSPQEWIEALGQVGGQNIESFGAAWFLFLMALSLLCSFVMALLYLVFYGRRATGSQVHRAFPLLGLSITAIFICIQFSLPLSLGLLGALSIVRFRTPVKEPEEIAFIMVVVANSLCCATFNIVFLGMVMGLTLLGLLLVALTRKLRGVRSDSGMVVITVPTSVFRERGEALLDTVKRTVHRPRLGSVVETDGVCTASCSFRLLREADVPKLHADIKDLAADAQSSVFFHHDDRA